MSTFDNISSLPNGQSTEIVKLSSGYEGLSSISSSPDQAGLWTALRRRWLPAIAVGATVFAGIAAYTLTRTPLYQSQTLILAANRPPVSVAPRDASSSSDKSEQDVSVDVQLLKSRPLVAKALQKLDDSYGNISVDQVMSNLTINQDKEGNVLTVAYTDTDPQRAKAVLEALGPTYVTYSLESRRSQASNAIKFIEANLPKARQSLNQTASQISSFRQKYGIVDPDIYAESVSGARANLQEQITEAEKSLKMTSRQYQELQRQMGQAGQNSSTVLADSVLSQDQAYQDLVTELRKVEAQYALESTRFQDSYPGLQNLKDRRNEIRRLLQQQTQRVLGGKASQSASKTATAGALQQGLADKLLEVQTNLATQTAQVNSLRQAEANMATQFSQIPSLQQGYAELQRQYKLQSDAVDSFLQKLHELEIVEAQETSPWKILEAPYLPGQPISPNIQRGLLLGLVAGGLLGVAAAILLERSDDRLRRVEEIKALVEVPLLAAVPKAARKDLAGSYANNYLFQHINGFTESIRSLALNLPHFKVNHDGGKLLAFTSAVPGEGKTTVTYNLGLALAELGKRVLVVDADLHNPSLHVVSQLPNSVGLSTAIATDQPWHKLIHSGNFKGMDVNFQATHVEQPKLAQSFDKSGAGTLVANHQSTQTHSDPASEVHHMVVRRPDILTAGPLPPNPIAWLNSEKMTDLLSEWSQAYDYVLIDTPPVVGIADAQSLATKVDGTILVVGIAQSSRSVVNRAMEILAGTRCHIPGVVVNLLDRDQKGYAYGADYASYYGR